MLLADSLTTMTATLVARKRAEERSAAATRQLRTILDKLPAGVLLMDTDGRYRFANQRAAVNLGLTPDEVVGKTLADVLPADVAQTYRERNRRFIAARDFAEYEATFDLPIGTRTFFIADQVFPGAEGIGDTLLSSSIDITAHQQTEAALQVALTKYQTLFDSFPLGITVADAIGQIIESNPTADRLLGLGEEEHRQRAIDGAEWQIVRSDGSPMPAEEYASVRALAEQRVVENVEMGVVTPCGTTTWINVTAAPLPLDGYGVVITYNNITARRQAEAALRESELKFRTLSSSIPQLIWTALPDGRMNYLSEQWQGYTGFPPGQLTDGGWEHLLHPDDVAETLDRWHESLQLGTPLEIKPRFRHQSGIWRWQLVRGIPLREPDGRIIEWVGTCTDIHESETREHHARFLLDLEQRTNYLEDPAQIEQVVIDRLGAYLGVTRCYFGHVVSEQVEVRHSWRTVEPTMIGVYQLIDYFSPEAIAQARQNIPTVVKDVTTDPRTAAAAANHRALGIGAFITMPVVYQETWVGALNIVSREARLWQPEEIDLLRQVGARIWHQLERGQAQVALHQALENLKRSNAELEQFAYVASHDLQEPLRGVTSMVQLLQQRYQGQLDARADQYIGLAVDAATRMQALINDLLAFSRVQRRAQPFRPIPLDKPLAVALANLQVAIEESGALITHDPLPTLQADAGQLTQLLQNLIGNAIKFHAEQTPRIHLSATRQEDAWCFAVRDNGIGIAPEYFERIFVIFQRLHARQAYPGTGIGLALCKKIVEHHGGQIWVESQLGAGATFFFTIPDRS
jgi:PAS domain S-box-containing protein